MMQNYPYFLGSFGPVFFFGQALMQEGCTNAYIAPGRRSFQQGNAEN